MMQKVKAWYKRPVFAWSLCFYTAVILAMRIFADQHNFEWGLSARYTIELVLITGVVIIYAGVYAAIDLICDITLEQIRRWSAPVLIGVAVGFLLLVWLDFQDYVCIFGRNRIEILSLTIPKAVFVDIASLVIFPTAALLLYACGEWRTFCIGTTMLSVIDMALMWYMGDVYILWLAVTHLAVVGTLFCSDLAAEEPSVPARRQLFFSGALFWGAALLVHGEGRPFQVLPSTRLAAIRTLLQGARLLGRAPYSDLVYDLLDYSENPIHSLLYYGGWIPTLLFVALMVGFLVQLVRIVSSSCCRMAWNGCFIAAAGAHLIMRTVFGLCTAFGIGGIRAALPFSGFDALEMDVVSLAMILCSAYGSGNDLLNCITSNFIDTVPEKIGADEEPDADETEELPEDALLVVEEPPAYLPLQKKHLLLAAVLAAVLCAAVLAARQYVPAITQQAEIAEMYTIEL